MEDKVRRKVRATTHIFLFPDSPVWSQVPLPEYFKPSETTNGVKLPLLFQVEGAQQPPLQLLMGLL